ncbi:hypothetical protein NPIL_591111 [Nephila pilipes]|uniref:Uncharacterized protein n=1 Tax=Nephila pilipes TaxID=299642 RepID=A0A8X6UPH1_NEPPI|nr:hypothetical protein NPIL_591111 [Nephila pilipes]
MVDPAFSVRCYGGCARQKVQKVLVQLRLFRQMPARRRVQRKLMANTETSRHGKVRQGSYASVYRWCAESKSGNLPPGYPKILLCLPRRRAVTVLRYNAMVEPRYLAGGRSLPQNGRDVACTIPSTGTKVNFLCIFGSIHIHRTK